MWIFLLTFKITPLKTNHKIIVNFKEMIYRFKKSLSAVYAGQNHLADKQITLRHVYLFLFCLAIASCNGQNNVVQKTKATKVSEENKTLGQVVAEMEQQIMKIFQDSKDNYWFGSRSQGVYKYDGKRLIQFSTKDGLCNNRIRGIQEDKFGNLYFDTGSGISKFDGQKFETLRLIKDYTNDWQLQEDDLWFVGDWNKNGAYRYDGKDLYHLKFPEHPLEAEAYEINPSPSFNPYEVYNIQKDSKGNIWFGTSVFGACRYDGVSHLWISEREMTEIDPGPAPGVRSILEDHKGDFWFSSNINHKYKILDTPLRMEADKLPYQKMEGINHSEVSEMPNFCMVIKQDDKGAIWLATYGSGVWKYDGGKVTHYQVRLTEKDVKIYTLFQDKKGALWLGTQNASVLKFNGKKFIPFKI